MRNIRFNEDQALQKRQQ